MPTTTPSLVACSSIAVGAAASALPDAGATRVVVLNARQANPDVPILARVAREEFDELVRRAGATAIVAPERAGALMLLEECARALGLDEALMTGPAREIPSPGGDDGQPIETVLPASNERTTSR